MTGFRQEFELGTNCKSIKTAFKRFEKEFPAAWEIWGELFEYMAENDYDHQAEIDKEFGGWSLWLDQDEQFGWYYMAIVLTDEAQKI